MTTIQAGITNAQQGSTPVAGPSTPVAGPGQWSLDGYVFDAWLELVHESELEVTQHPVMLGASIGDHCFSKMRKFTFKIGMSDCNESAVPGQFPAAPTRSIGTYKTLQALQKKPLTTKDKFCKLVSKYTTSNYILITHISIPDDFRSKNALFATITLVEVIVVNSQTVKTSSVPEITDQTPRGQVKPQPTPAQVTEARQKGAEALIQGIGFGLSGN